MVVLIARKSGKVDTVHLWSEPRNAYLSSWSGGQTQWLTEREAEERDGSLRKNPDGTFQFEKSYSLFVDPLGEGVEKKGYTACLEGVGEFLNMEHVRWFFEEYFRDPIVEETRVEVP
jgi:hypothetical protein